MNIIPVFPAQDEQIAVRLLAIQLAAYEVEAALIGDRRIPALRENLGDLRAAPLNWIAALDDDGKPVGAAAWSQQPGVVTIDRLIVEPAAHRRGIGRALVTVALAEADGRSFTVATGRRNIPAIALYEQLGFTRSHDVEVEPGLWITHLQHTAMRC